MTQGTSGKPFQIMIFTQKGLLYFCLQPFDLEILVFHVQEGPYNKIMHMREKYQYSKLIFEPE